MPTIHPPAVHIAGLHKSFKDNHVLRGIDLDIPSGIVFALLGANGAGKTTVINILTTLLTPDAGTVRVAGYDVVTEADKVRASIGVTGQFAAVDGLLTGEENLRMMARLAHLDTRRASPCSAAASCPSRHSPAGSKESPNPSRSRPSSAPSAASSPTPRGKRCDMGRRLVHRHRRHRPRLVAVALPPPPRAVDNPHGRCRMTSDDVPDAPNVWRAQSTVISTAFIGTGIVMVQPSAPAPGGERVRAG